MSTETSREVIGATTHGEVTIITKAVPDHDRSGEATQVKTKDLHIVRQGSSTIIETEDRSEAESIAKSLAKAGAIVAPGVDERLVGEQGDTAPHAHRIATHEVRPEAEAETLVADEPHRIDTEVDEAHEEPKASSRKTDKESKG